MGKGRKFGNWEKIISLKKGNFFFDKICFQKNNIMTSEDKLVLSYMQILKGLSNEIKLKLISKLVESVIQVEPTSSAKPAEDDSWKSLFGAWKDTDPDLAKDIIESRLSNREIPSFD